MRTEACMFTGYRPEKFDFDFLKDSPRRTEFANRLYYAVNTLIEKGVREFYTGMAMGFDIFAGEYIALIKKARKDIKLYAAVPFYGQEAKFPKLWQERYIELISSCDEVFTLSDAYERGAFFKRNRFMADHSAYCITYFDGKPGGTASTLKYAESKGLEIVNVFKDDPFEDMENTAEVLMSIFDELQNADGGIK